MLSSTTSTYPPIYVDLAFPVGTDKVFTYSVPAELRESVRAGVRAIAPFGKRKTIGIIVCIANTTSVPNLKSISDILDSDPVVSEEMLKLSRWIAEYYCAPLGEVLKAALPHGFSGGSKRIVSPTNRQFAGLKLPRRQLQILEHLKERGKTGLAQLQKQLRIKSIYAAINRLAVDGFVEVSEEPLKGIPKPAQERVVAIDNNAKGHWRVWHESALQRSRSASTQKQIALIEVLLSAPETELPLPEILKRAEVTLSTVRTLAQKGVVAITTRERVRSPHYEPYDAALGALNVQLMTAQQHAVDSISSALAAKTFQTFLLHGVTGSGKTQVYIEVIRKAFDDGRSAIVLVPEISLTPQIVRRFMHYFGDRVAVMHSRMSAGERYDSWRSIRAGKHQLVIGPRSAVFAPLHNLGLIIVDEEQESSYKQFDQTPRYHARDVAIVRAHGCSGVVVLGSATPSIESYHNAESGKYTLLELPERVDNAQLPTVDIVDMTAERRRKLLKFREERKDEFKKDPVQARASKRRFEPGAVSDLLKEKIEDRLRKGEGIILLQNRRGFAPFVECLECGYVEMCDNCSVTLTYHLAKRHLRCHYCGFVKTPPDVCPSCKGVDIRLHGYGTQRIEDEVKQLFPEARLARMDLDTTSQKGAHDRILRKFAEGEADILLGTQMVAKGLDFSRVTLVGVVSADIQMLLPDFRSAERTFQLLTQVAGRAGRSGALRGEVVVQTSQPHHYALKHVVTHNFREFYKEELLFRQELDYPPFGRLALIEFRSENESEAKRHAEHFAKLLKSLDGHFNLLGPAPAAIPKLKTMSRWHIVLKSLKALDPASHHLHRALREAARKYSQSSPGKSKRVKLIVDVEPVGMM